jgi:membrane-associated protein
MSYRWFLMYNVLGAVLWISGFVLAGYFFGSLPVVKENFSLIVYAIIGLSLFAVGSIIVGMVRSPKPDAENNPAEPINKE